MRTLLALMFTCTAAAAAAQQPVAPARDPSGDPSGHIAGARELMKSGVLGKISRIDETRNSTPPYWYSYLKRDRAADVGGDQPQSGALVAL